MQDWFIYTYLQVNLHCLPSNSPTGSDWYNLRLDINKVITLENVNGGVYIALAQLVMKGEW